MHGWPRWQARGEVLVSSTVRDIVTGSRRTFAERGDYELKVVPDRWRLYALVRERATTRRSGRRP